jgi:hypothetical protein
MGLHGISWDYMESQAKAKKFKGIKAFILFYSLNQF